jgi:hypothetical protein
MVAGEITSGVEVNSRSTSAVVAVSETLIRTTYEPALTGGSSLAYAGYVR